MSRNQKAPLLAFFLVALTCSLVLVASLRGEASMRPSDLGAATSTLPLPSAGSEPAPPFVLPEATAPVAEPQHMPSRALAGGVAPTGREARARTAPTADRAGRPTRVRPAATADDDATTSAGPFSVPDLDVRAPTPERPGAAIPAQPDDLLPEAHDVARDHAAEQPQAARPPKAAKPSKAAKPAKVAKPSKAAKPAKVAKPSKPSKPSKAAKGKGKATGEPKSKANGKTKGKAKGK